MSFASNTNRPTMDFAHRDHFVMFILLVFSPSLPYHPQNPKLQTGMPSLAQITTQPGAGAPPFRALVSVGVFSPLWTLALRLRSPRSSPVLASLQSSC